MNNERSKKLDAAVELYCNIHQDVEDVTTSLLNDSWFTVESTKNGAHYKFTWESIEGTYDDFIGMKTALDTGGKFISRRCAAVTMSDGLIYIWSPRNSIESVEISQQQAKKLAESIGKVCKDAEIRYRFMMLEHRLDTQDVEEFEAMSEAKEILAHYYEYHSLNTLLSEDKISKRDFVLETINTIMYANDQR